MFKIWVRNQYFVHITYKKLYSSTMLIRQVGVLSWYSIIATEQSNFTYILYAKIFFKLTSKSSEYVVNYSLFIKFDPIKTKFDLNLALYVLADNICKLPYATMV